MSHPPIEQSVILAAGQGTRLRPLTEDRPKCLVSLHGRPLLDWHSSALREAGIQKIAVVAGYRSDQLCSASFEVFRNPDFQTTNMVESLWCASQRIMGGALISYGDIIFTAEVARLMLSSPHDISVAVDRRWLPYWERRFANPSDDAESLSARPDGRITSIGRKGVPLADIEGQYIGLIALSPKGATALRERTNRMGARSRKAFMTDLLQDAIDSGIDVHATWIEGGWLEVDSISDLQLAEELTTLRDHRLEILR